MEQSFTAWLYILTCFVHDFSVAVYLGGAVAMEFILGPAQRAIPPAQAQVMGEKSSDRFLILVWSALVLILVTGIIRLSFKGMMFTDAGIFSPPLSLDFSYGRTVLAMFLIWCLLTLNGSLITFVYRPRLKGKLSAGTSQAQVNQDRDAKMQAANRIQTLTRVDLGLATLATLFGASLVWGGLL